MRSIRPPEYLNGLTLSFDIRRREFSQFNVSRLGLGKACVVGCRQSHLRTGIFGERLKPESEVNRLPHFWSTFDS